MKNYPTGQSTDSLDALEYTADELKDDKQCAHHFKRVSPYRVECSKCHAGYMDSPDSPFPVEELNSYYQIPEVQEYNKWL